MNDNVSGFIFDKRDHELIRIVNDVLQGKSSTRYARRFYYPYFHSHGIKKMTETRGLRIAYAVVHLLSSLEVGGVEDRINALRLLRNEVIDTAEGPMSKNTARVLLQIMKDLLRVHGDYHKQLQLAYDFRTAATGNPGVIRRQLKRYHLLEMPEDWNQIAFDDHVHDVNTKGRKSSTHLIMDAWIKGIQRLRVIHYNFIEPRFAAELLEAAGILKIDIRIGIEFYARFHDKYVQLIWVPRGFHDVQAFLCFLAEPAVMKIMDAGRKVSLYQQKYIPALLKKFNESHRPKINRIYGIELPLIKEQEFLAYVNIGQKSKLHLAEFIHNRMLKGLKDETEQMRAEFPSASSKRRDTITQWVESMNTLDLESVIDGYLEPGKNPEIRYPEMPYDGPDVPELLRLSPFEILARLAQLYSGHRVTLDRGFGITTETSPVFLYTFMALANGIYLSSHNVFRGLPKGAVYGNFFRSLLSIPVAVILNAGIGSILSMSGTVGINDILQKWAAIISKAASDFVAGFIEGTADRYKNIRTRLREYKNKFREILDIYAKLELLYPDVESFKILEHPSDVNLKANGFNDLSNPKFSPSVDIK